jgi:hypothetical protein
MEPPLLLIEHERKEVEGEQQQQQSPREDAVSSSTFCTPILLLQKKKALHAPLVSEPCLPFRYQVGRRRKDVVIWAIDREEADMILCEMLEDMQKNQP